MKTILLSGATGFLGSHLLPSLLDSGNNVIILKRTGSNTNRILDWLYQCTCYNINQISPSEIFHLHDIDVVISAACNYGKNGEDISSILEANTFFPIQLLENAISAGVETFINVDTMLPRNTNAYTLSKSQFVDWLQFRNMTNLKIINLKIEHIYGNDLYSSNFINWILNQLKDNVPGIALTKGEQIRDFIHVDDVVTALLTLLNQASSLPNYSEFEVGTGKSYPLRYVVECLVSEFKSLYPNNQTKIKFGEIQYRNNEPMQVVVNNTKLVSLGWKPRYGLVDGLSNIITHMNLTHVL